MKYQWHFEVVWENFPIMLSGIGLTIALSILSMLAGAILGMVIALARLSPWTWLRGLAYCYTELFRTTPLLVQIVWVFYVLPLVTGIAFTPFYSGLVAFGLNIAAFMAEIYRAGITSVGRGQTEASLALGMTNAQVMRRILIPQAVTRMIPPIGTMWISLFKDTSLVSAIGVTELHVPGALPRGGHLPSGGDLHHLRADLLRDHLSPVDRSQLALPQVPHPGMTRSKP